MSWRDIVVHNSRLKLTAVLLALLSWCAIKFAIFKGIAAKSQSLQHQQVMVLKTPDDESSMRVEPPYVDLSLQSSKEVSGGDVKVFVDVTKMPEGIDNVFKPVMVQAPGIEKVLSIEPGWFVRVVRVTPPDPVSTNAFRKP